MHPMLVELERKIASLQTLVNQLQTNEAITDLEKDLLKQKCVELYEHILSGTEAKVHINIPTPQVVVPTPPVVKPIEPVEVVVETVPEKTPEIVAETILLNDIPPVEEKPAPVVVADLFAVATPTEIQNQQIEEIIEIEHLKEEPSTPLMKEEVQEISLHEKIAFAMPPKLDLSERLANESIPSLKSAINVNLKIAIVNDLFKENTVEYVKAIDKLNSSENIHEAMRYFTELKHTYDWDNQNQYVKELESLITKRFS